jgi:hypothetical protein
MVGFGRLLNAILNTRLPFADRGGTMVSNLLEPAQAAWHKAVAFFRDARNKVSDPRLKAIAAAHSLLVARKIEAEQQAAQANVDLADFEAAANAFLALVEGRPLVRLSDPDAQTRAHDSALRAKRAMAASQGAARPAIVRPPVAKPITAIWFGEMAAYRVAELLSSAAADGTVRRLPNRRAHGPAARRLWQWSFDYRTRNKRIWYYLH